MGYRADIDGLRAIAVLAILAYHYGLPLPGGFAGVDIFFVISGYLISAFIHGAVEGKSFSVLGFYDRRIRRILPALLAMLVVVCALGAPLLLPAAYSNLSESAIFAAFGVSNFYFFAHTGYFDPAGGVLPLLHTWSLGVEEQFYLIWPGIFTGLCMVARRRPTIIAVILGALIVASFAASLMTLGVDPKISFYFPHTRAWEFALGSLLVFLPALGRRPGEFANIAGLLLIGLGLVIISEAEPFPGWNALLPCCGAALILWAKSDTWTGSVIAAGRRIGLISYSLYLWHWPVWAFYRIYANDRHPTALESAVLACIAMVIAAASFKFIEQPFRKLRGSHVGVIGAGILSSGIVAMLAFWVVQERGFPTRIPPEYLAMESPETMWNWDGCRYSELFGGSSRVCTFGVDWQSAGVKGLLWGDSHAQHFAPLIEPFVQSANAAIALHKGCPPILDAVRFRATPSGYPANYDSECGRDRVSMLRVLKDHPEINLVILASAWSFVLPFLRGGETTTDEKSRSALLERALDATVEELERPGRRVVLIGSAPGWWPDNPVLCELSGAPVLRASCEPPTLSQARSNQTQGITYDVISRVAARHPGTLAILPGIAMCRSGFCISKLNGEMLYMDSGHIRRNLKEPTRRMLGDLIGFREIADISELGSPAH